MEVIYGILAAIVGAALGWIQYKMLQLIIAKGKIWLIAVKLPLWAICMLAAVAISITVLIGFVVGASISFIAFGYAQWRKPAKENEPCV
jgi:hypothetical protein